MKTNSERNIRIFISSTFSDMQSERDYLIKKVFPRLQVEAEKHNVFLTPLDLRWGVTEEETKSGKVIQVCLQEIENSRPFFIGIIGNRYGWCPTREELEKNGILRERWGHWLEKDISKGLSVTEIEMQYGVLRSEEKCDAYFYIKRGGSDALEDADKLEKLRNTIRTNGRYPVEEYETPESLGQKVEKAFMRLLDERFPIGDFSNMDKDRIANEAFLQSRTEIYVSKHENIRAIEEFLSSRSQHNLVILGKSGSGKSALIANWIRNNTNTDYHVVYLFVGNGMQMNNHYNIINYICEEIRRLYQIPYKQDDSKKGTKEYFDSVLNSIHDKKQLLIILDGIDQIVDVDDAKLLNWLPFSYEKVKMLFSTTPDDLTYQSLVYHKCQIHSLVRLDSKDRMAFVRGYLARHGRRLTEKQVELIACDCQNENMLVLRALLDELLGFGVHEHLDERIEYYLRPDSIEGFFQKVLERNENDYSDDFVERVLSLIAFSHSGLQESEIIEMTSVNQLQWSQFYCAFRNNLIERGGLLTFSHNYIADAVRLRYAAKEEQSRKMILGYFGKDKTSRSKYEIPYQLYKLQSYDLLYLLLLIPDIFQYLLFTNRIELVEYWRALREKDRLKYRLSGYLDEKHDYNLADYFKTPSELARYYYSIGSFIGDFFSEYQLVLECYNRSLDVTARENTLENAITYNNMGSVYGIMARYDDAITSHNRALNIRLHLLKPDHPHIAQSYTNLGFVYDKQAKYNEALFYFMKSLEIHKQLVSDDRDVWIANDYNNIGHVLTNMGRLQEGLEYQKKALTMRQVLQGDNNYETGMSYHNVGAVLFLLGRPQEALPYLKKASDIWVSVFGERHPQVATGWHDLGCLYRQMAQFGEAVELIERALNVRIEILKEYHPDTLNSYNVLADLCFQVQDYEKSKMYYTKLYSVLSEYPEKLDPNYYLQTLALGGIGMTNSMLGNYNEGEIYLRKAIELCRSHMPQNNQLLAGLYNNLFSTIVRRDQGLKPNEKLRISIDTAGFRKE